MVWDRATAPFSEIWYATMTDQATGIGLWFRYTITVSEDRQPYCEVWGFVFDPRENLSWGAKNRWPIDRLGRARDDGALVRIGESWLSESHMEGTVQRERELLRWSFDWNPAGAAFQHIPTPLRSIADRRGSVVCAPNLSVELSGSIEVRGRHLDIASARGCQAHRWGVVHPMSWAWGHCDVFDEPGVVFEGVVARTRLAGAGLPPVTLLYVRHEGRDFVFNDLRGALRARSRYRAPRWDFSARSRAARLTGVAELSPAQAVQVRYEDPDGSSRYCVNSEIANLTLELSERARNGWSPPRAFVAQGSAHVEFGRVEPWPEPSVLAT